MTAEPLPAPSSWPVPPREGYCVDDHEERDRDTKPHKYAAAGIPYFRRVEMAGEKNLPVVYEYTSDVMTKAYVATALHKNRLKTSLPYTIDIDLSEIERM